MALWDLINSICELYKTFPDISNWIKIFQDYINQFICTSKIFNFSWILRTRIRHTTCIRIYSQWGPDSFRKPISAWILSQTTFEDISVFYWLANQRSLLIYQSKWCKPDLYQLASSQETSHIHMSLPILRVYFPKLLVTNSHRPENQTIDKLVILGKLSEGWILIETAPTNKFLLQIYK